MGYSNLRIRRLGTNKIVNKILEVREHLKEKIRNSNPSADLRLELTILANVLKRRRYDCDVY
jgi:hypothetical protein